MTRRSRRSRRKDTSKAESESESQVEPLVASPSSPPETLPPLTRTKRRPITAEDSPEPSNPRKKTRIEPGSDEPRVQDAGTNPTAHLLEAFHMFRLAPRPRSRGLIAPNLTQGFRNQCQRIRLAEQSVSEELEETLKKQHKREERLLANKKPTENSIETFPTPPPARINRKSYYLKQAADTSKFSALNEHEFEVPTIKLEFPNRKSPAFPKTAVGVTSTSKANPESMSFNLPRAEPTKKNLLQCSRCDYTSIQNKNLNRHHFRMHTVLEKAIECCDLSFKTRWEALAHNRSIHPRSNFECPHSECQNRQFYRHSKLVQHLAEAHSEQKYQCKDCRYTTDLHSNLIRHRRMMHRCSNFGKEFNDVLEPEVTLTTAIDNDDNDVQIKSEPVDKESSDATEDPVKVKNEPLDD